MARALRIDAAGAWYHIMNRKHRGGTLFCDDADRRRFLNLVAELPERFGLEVHTFVLMDNHYHLLLRTTEANLSDAVRSPWEEWAERHGDWGRDAAMYVSVPHGRMRLAEVVRAVKGLRYQAAARAVKRFGEAIAQDPERRRFASKLAQQLSTV
jgi:hypothetical protein